MTFVNAKDGRPVPEEASEFDSETAETAQASSSAETPSKSGEDEDDSWLD